VFFVLDIEFSIIKMNESFHVSPKTFLFNRSFDCSDDFESFFETVLKDSMF